MATKTKSVAETPPEPTLVWSEYLALHEVPGWIRLGLECAGDTSSPLTLEGWNELVGSYPYRVVK